MSITKVADPITPDETQTLEDTPKISTAWKGHFSRSEINEYLLPGKDRTSTLLRIWGPAEGGARIKMDDIGGIGIICGRHDKEYGNGSGRLNISSHGGLWKNEGTLHISCNQEDGDASKKDKNGEAKTDKDALNVKIESGNYTEVTNGGQRYIEANIIHIKAIDQLILEGSNGIRMITGGDIVTGATDETNIIDNKMDVIFGQDLKAGVKENTTVSYDPRSTQTVLTPGHLNHKILGDYKLWVAGNYQHWTAGKQGGTKLIKNASASVDIRAFLDDLKIKAKKGIEMITDTEGIYAEAKKGDIDILTKDGDMTFESTGDATIESTSGDLTLKGKETTSISGKSVEIDSTGGDVKISTSGGIIKLN
tara:strand:- start:1996 stop:3090 length:1095 start_codon:yes stop_codon:yes gene_type:complete